MSVFKSAFSQKTTQPKPPGLSGSQAPKGSKAPLTTKTYDWKFDPAAPVVAPWDANYESTKNALDKNYSVAKNNLASNRTLSANNYGYNVDGSEQSAAQNPMSRLSQLRADYEKIKRGASTSYAARGQLYSGAYQNQVNSNADANLRNEDSLLKAFQQAMADYNTQQTGIDSQYTTDLASAGTTKTTQQADAVADGTTPMYNQQRRSQVVAALQGPLRQKTRDRLEDEARKNGWI